MSGFAAYEDTIIKSSIEESSLIMGSKIVSLGWKEDSTVSSYVACGLAIYIDLIEIGALSWSANITGRDDETCDFVPLVRKYAEEHNMTELTKNRLSNMGVATVAFRIATQVLQVGGNEEEVELARKLGFDDEGIRILTTSEKLKNT